MRPQFGRYDEAKVGIFMHWGVYSVPSFISEWFWLYWKEESLKPDHLAAVAFMKASPQSPFFPSSPCSICLGGELPPWVHLRGVWAPVHGRVLRRCRDCGPCQGIGSQVQAFPLLWNVMESCGCRYFVPTSKHHEGYTMYPSRYSWNWNSADVGPKRDLLGWPASKRRRWAGDWGSAGELRTALLAQGGVHFGLYFSQYEWFNRLYTTDKASNYTKTEYPQARHWQPRGEPPWSRWRPLEMVSLPQLRELVDNYQPEVIWSDGDWEAGPAYWNSTGFLAWLYSHRSRPLSRPNGEVMSFLALSAPWRSRWS